MSRNESAYPFYHLKTAGITIGLFAIVTILSLLFTAVNVTAGYAVYDPNRVEKISTNNALYLAWPGNSNSRYSSYYTPPNGGSITKFRVNMATESGFDYFRVYSSSGASLYSNSGTYTGWQTPSSAQTSIRTYITTDGSVQSGFGGNVDSVEVLGAYDTILVEYPNGNELLVVDSIYSVQWAYPIAIAGLDSFALSYSINGGVDWLTLGKTHSSETSFDWEIENLISDQCLIRLGNATNGTWLDTTDATFSIVWGTLNVTSPNSSAVSWIGGNTETITWDAQGGLGTVTISYSIDNGTTWIEISAGEDNDGSYDWTIPDVGSSQCRVKVVSDLHPEISDISNAAFTLELTPRIELTAPNGSENWIAGTIHDITWTSITLKTGVLIEYSTDNGASWDTIATNTPDDGLYSWQIPYEVSDNCLIRVSENDGSPVDQSDDLWSIGTPIIELTSPNGGEKWYKGHSKVITWENTGTVGDVRLEYSTDNGIVWNGIVAGLTNDGDYTWTVPSLNSTQCKIRISDMNNVMTYDISEAVFEITDEPVVTLISPNGGEGWTEATTETITWSTVGAVGNVTIEYSNDGKATWDNIVTNTANDGSYDWAIPRDPSVNCFVRVYDVDSTHRGDTSASAFTLRVKPLITLTSPMGGEDWETGTNHTISWTWEGIVGNVMLQYSSDGQESWNQIIASTANDGAYTWTIPDDVSTNCYVRISEVGDEVPADTSAGAFEIYPPTITITAPNGGEWLNVGGLTNISWTSRGTVGDVKLSYSADNGASYTTIEEVTANDGAYGWSIPMVNSDSVLLKVEMVSNNSIFDVSDDVLTISVPQAITLNSPNGGEVCSTGQDLEITWSTGGVVSGIDIFFSGDDGATWSSVVTNTEDDGSYTWTVPQSAVTTTGKIIVSDVDGDPADTSDAVFTIENRNYIFLSAGWNTISFNTSAPDMSCETVFGSVSPLVLAKNGEGEVFIPDMVNTIDSINVLNGYQVYVSGNGNVSIIGSPVDPTTAITLNSGWNLISYLPVSAMAVADVFSSIADSVTLVKNGSGEIYMPEYGINSIGNMVPGEGYWVHMKNSETLVYDAASAPAVAFGGGDLRATATHFTFTGNTGNNMIVVIPSSVAPTIFDTAIENGDEIGVFNASGLCVGAAQWDGANIAITVWGDDDQTPAVDGMVANENLVFKVYDASADLEYEAEFTFSGGNSYYSANGISYMATLNVVASGNQVPTFTTAAPQSINEDSSIVIDLTMTDAADADSDPLTIIAAEGNNYSVSGLTITPDANYYGTLTVSLKVTDGIDTTAAVDMEIVVASVNDVPTLKYPLNDTTVEVSAYMEYEIPADLFDDIESAGSLVISVSGLPAELSFDGNLISGTPGTVNDYLIIVEAADDSFATVSDTFSLSVQPITEITEMDNDPFNNVDELTFAPNPVPTDAEEVFFVTPSVLAGAWEVVIFDYLGEVVDRQNFRSSGGYTYRWDLKNLNGADVASGTYVAVITYSEADGSVKKFRRAIGVER